MQTENINFKKTMLIIAFILLMDYGSTYSYCKMLRKFHNLLHFRALCHNFESYGFRKCQVRWRVVPGISWMKLHTLLRFSVHFVNLTIQAHFKNNTT